MKGMSVYILREVTLSIGLNLGQLAGGQLAGGQLAGGQVAGGQLAGDFFLNVGLILYKIVLHV